MIFAVFLLWIAVTGVLSQIVPLFGGGEDQHRPDAQAGAATDAKAAFVCPPDYTCRPKPKSGGSRALVSLLHDLHPGKSMGPVGVVIATVSGFAMIFFALSGLWVFIQMWRNRKDRALSPRWFWK